MAYVQGYVAAVPDENRDAFIESSVVMCAMMKEFGALQAVDCWGADVPEGELTSFPKAVQKRTARRSPFPGRSGRTRRRPMLRWKR